MKKQFVPYRQSLELKELGFNQECIARYWTNIFQLRSPENFNSENHKINSVSAPIWQQCFNWIEDNYKIYVTMDNLILSYSIVTITESEGIKIVRNMSANDYFKSREEINLECLKELLQIINKKDQ